MLYNVLSPERPHTRPSRFVDKGSRRRPRMQGRGNRGEVMTFSVDFLPGFSDERGSMTPVYVADRCGRPQQSWTQPMQQPVSPFDVDRRRAPLVGRDGVRLSAGVGLLLAVLIMLGGICAFTCAKMISLNYQTDVMRGKIREVNQMCEGIEAQIADSESEISVTNGAVALGMVYARSADIIYLNAPENAIYSNPGTGTLSTEYLATVFGQ